MTSLDRFLGRRTCIGCGATKPLDQFSLNQGRVHSRCKECRARQRRAERAGARWVTLWSGDPAEIPGSVELARQLEQVTGRCYEIRVFVTGDTG